MTDINNLEEIKKIDKNDLYSSIVSFPKQIEQVWNEFKNVEVSENYKNISNVVISGMGGSALGGRIVDSLLNDRVRVPIEISTEYKLPAYVNENTLVILTSYSGNTEETIESANDALIKNAKIFGISTNGKLKKFLDNEKLPGYIFIPTENPSRQPRMGLGYSIISTLAILSKLNLIHLTDEEIKNSITLINSLIKDFSKEIENENNVAKKIALKLRRKIPVLISSEHLYGASHEFKNQLNENSKTFALLFDLPEANHHLMEGLSYPTEAKNLLHFLFIESEKYTNSVKKRYPITMDVVEKNGIEVSSYNLLSNTKLDQIFEVITLGLFVSYYLAIINNTDPIPIPWVDYFKNKLS